MPSPSGELSREQKHIALERVLQSRAFGRSRQLRAFLRYICEAELEGKAHELNEYALGVCALGRPEGYSPAEDSCVRSRAYELRNKLRVYYDHEAPDDPIRIDIARGGYIPRFSQSFATLKGTDSPRVAAPSSDAELSTLWGPFIGSDAPLLIAFDVRLFFFSPATGLVVRDYQCNDPAELDQSEPLASFREQSGDKELRETRDYADFGSVHAAFLLGRLLAGNRQQAVLKHSGSLDWQDLWNSNLVFIGKPNGCPLIRSFLEDKPLHADDDGAIHDARPPSGQPATYHCATTHGTGVKYALITRVRGPQSGRHMLLLCGAGAELMWALAESVTNPLHAREIMSYVRNPSGHYAENFQVVIRAKFQSNVPVEIRCVTHHLLPAS